METTGILISAALALLTAGLVYYARQQVRAATFPNVIVYTEHRDTAQTVIQIVIKNVGNGLARDVTFDLSRRPPSKAWGLEIETAKVPDLMSGGPLITGIPALGPGTERRIHWGQYAGLKAALGDDMIYVVCKFQHPFSFLGMPMATRLETVSVLEVDSYLYTAASEAPEAKIARHLEQLVNHFKAAFPGWGPIRVRIEPEEKHEAAEDAA